MGAKGEKSVSLTDVADEREEGRKVKKNALVKKN